MAILVLAILSVLTWVLGIVAQRVQKPKQSPAKEREQVKEQARGKA